MWATRCVVQAKRHIHGPRAASISAAVAQPPSASRCSSPGAGVESSKKSSGTDAGPRLAAVGIGFQINVSLLDRAPQPFDEDVVHEAAASVHRNATPAAAACRRSLGGESRALIGIENPRLSTEAAPPPAPPRRSSHRWCSTAATPEPPARPVDDRHQIEEAARHRDVGHVGRRHVVRLDNFRPRSR